MPQNKNMLIVVIGLLGLFVGIIFMVNQHVNRELQEVEAGAKVYRAAPAVAERDRSAAPSVAQAHGQTRASGGDTPVSPQGKEEKVIYEMPATDVILVQ